MPQNTRTSSPARFGHSALAAGLWIAGCMAAALPAPAQTRLLILMKDGKTQEQALSGIRRMVWQSPDLVFHLEGDRALRVPHADIQRITFAGSTALRSPVSAGAGLRLVPGAARDGRLPMRLDLPVSASLRVELLALDGRLVATLAEGPRSAGVHDFAWDGRDGRGVPAEPGAYVLRAATPSGAVSSIIPWLE